MKKIILSLSMLLVCSCSSISYETKALIDQQAPNTRLLLLNGEYVSLRNYQGKNVVLIFWASWCSYSKKFMTELTQYLNSTQLPNTEVIAVSIDDYNDLTNLKNMIFFEGYDNQITHAFSGNGLSDEAYNAFHMIAVPSVVIINPESDVVAVGNSVNTIKRFFRDFSH